MTDPKNGSSHQEGFAVKAGAPIVVAVWLVLAASTASAGPRELTEFSVPTRTPDPLMLEGAEFARGLHPQAEISFWESESGTLSVSRVEGTAVKCVVRSSADARRALNPLGRFMDGRLEIRSQVLFAMAHEIGHCKLREAFLQRPDGRAADPSVFPWLAQEAAADAYGILSAERKLGADSHVRQTVIISRMLASAMLRDPNHATGHYISSALSLCSRNRSDADAVQCAVATAYYTVGSLANDEQGAPVPVDSPPQVMYELGVKEVTGALNVYDNIAQYWAKFRGADLRRFAFSQISRRGQSRYIAAVGAQQADAAHTLADYYGFRTGELATEDRHHIAALRIDGPEEFDWLLTLGAVVRTEDGRSLRKIEDPIN